MAIRAHDLIGQDESRLDCVITPMRRRHLREVLRIEQQVYPKPWTKTLYLGELALRNSRIYLVARAADAVVGYCGLMIIDDEAHVTTVAVDPAFHRHKIASQLLVVLARCARRRGVENLTLEVRVSSTGAQALYSRFGFAPAGVRKNYYAEVQEDAMVMWSHDIHSAEYADRLDRIQQRLGSTIITEGVTWLN